jgi:hypothetical protein
MNKTHTVLHITHRFARAAVKDKLELVLDDPYGFATDPAEIAAIWRRYCDIAADVGVSVDKLLAHASAPERQRLKEIIRAGDAGEGAEAVTPMKTLVSEEADRKQLKKLDAVNKQAFIDKRSADIGIKPGTFHTWRGIEHAERKAKELVDKFDGPPLSETARNFADGVHDEASCDAAVDVPALGTVELKRREQKRLKQAVEAYVARFGHEPRPTEMTKLVRKVVRR